MSRLSRCALPMAPALLAAGLLGPWAGAVRALEADPGAVRLIQALEGLAIAAPAILAIAAARFHQVRLTLTALLLAVTAAVVVASPEWLAGPGAPALVLSAALALGLGSRLPERGVGSRAGMRGLALAATLAALPAWLAHAHAEELARLLARLGPAAQPTPGLGVPWLGLAALVLAILACARAPGRDADVLGPGLACGLGAVAAGLCAAPGLAAAIALLAGASAGGASLVVLAWRRGFVDDLTQLPGRRALDVALDGLAGRYALAVIDVDHFKRFNDEHGHDAGDDALRIVAGVLRGVRGGAAYRQGGEEFVAIFPGRTLAEAAEALEELRAAIEETPLLVRSAGRRRALRVTVSIGVAERSAAHPGARPALRAADQALLRAKRLGRNRVEIDRRREARASGLTAPARSSRTAPARRAADARPRPRRAASPGR